MKKITLTLFAAFALTLVYLNHAATSRGPSAGDAAPLGAVTEYQLSFAPSNTVANATTVKHGLMPTLTNDLTVFMRGDGQWVSPISQYGLTAGRIPMAFHGPSDTFVDSGLSQDFGGNITFNGAHDFNILSGTLTITGDTANTLVYLDGSKHLKSAILGAGLSLSGGTLDTVAGGGNVTATPTTAATHYLTRFTNPAGTDIEKTELLWDTGVLNVPGEIDITGDLNVGNDIHATTVTADQITLAGHTLGALEAGTYAPTVNLIANAVAATPSVCMYSRVDNIVHVSGRVNVTVSASGSTAIVDLSLPVDSTFSSADSCAGVGVRRSPSSIISFDTGASIVGNGSLARLSFTPQGNNAQSGDYVFNFDYTIEP